MLYKASRSTVNTETTMTSDRLFLVREFFLITQSLAQITAENPNRLVNLSIGRALARKQMGICRILSAPQSGFAMEELKSKSDQGDFSLSAHASRTTCSFFHPKPPRC